MGIPKQVQERGEKANKLLSGTEGDTENKAPDTDPQDNNEQPPPEKAPEHVDGEEKTWEHRFVTLSGKYNREIEEVRNVVIPENARLKDQIAKMSIKMDELHTALDELRNKPVTPAEPREVLTEEDWQVLENEDISKPVMDVIRKAINAEVSRATTPIEQRIQRTERSVEQTEKTAEQQRQELFRKAVEDRITEGTTLTFEKINEDPGFREWLDGYIPYTNGVTRRKAAEKAISTGDHMTISQICIDWAQENGFGRQQKTLRTELEPNPANIASPRVSESSNIVLDPRFKTMKEVYSAFSRKHISQDEYNAYDQKFKELEQQKVNRIYK
jgi:TolA-binding protein